MKQTRHASYQPLLKSLAHAAIAHRPQDWTEGEVLLRPGSPSVGCAQRRSEDAPQVPVAPPVLTQAQTLAQALTQDGLPWVACRIGFFRKPVGWGVRVRITPAVGAPEVDLTPERGPAAAPPVAAAVEPPLPTLSPLAGAAPGGDVPPAWAPTQPALAGGGGVSTSSRPALVCDHCQETALLFKLSREGLDHYRCHCCGYEVAMHARPDFDDSAYRLPRGGEAEPAPEAPAELRRSLDGQITGPEFSLRFSTPETLLYEVPSGQVPMRVVADPERGARVVEANRVTTMDTPFGSRMLTPREHATILRHLAQAVPLMPGRFFIE